jgi:hypothetical protein
LAADHFYADFSFQSVENYVSQPDFPIRVYVDRSAASSSHRDRCGSDHPLAPFLPLFLEKTGPDRPTVPIILLQSAHARLGGDATTRTLIASGLDAPIIDGAL